MTVEPIVCFTAGLLTATLATATSSRFEFIVGAGVGVEVLVGTTVMVGAGVGDAVVVGAFVDAAVVVGESWTRFHVCTS